ncbi:unnamed protein product, partial [Phaeothamnion confervicola]
LLQVAGANTSIGKTVVSAGLCRAALRVGVRVSYIKPVQTGPDADADAVARWCTGPAGERSDHLRTSTLFHYNTPISPHLASALDGTPATDAAVLDLVVATINRHFAPEPPPPPIPRPNSTAAGARAAAPNTGRLALLEMAGGVLSPGPSGTLQADLFRPLRLPALLVGDGRLGGISATLSALESLLLRGYTVRGVAVVDSPERLANADSVEAYLEATRDAVSGVAGPVAAAAVFRLPPMPPSPLSLVPWFAESAAACDGMLAELGRAADEEVRELAAFPARARRRVWWPFTQHRNMTDDSVTVIDSAYGDYLHTWSAQAEKPLHPATAETAGTVAPESPPIAAPVHSRLAAFDATASWWTQGVGRGGSVSALALAAAAGRYGHVMLPANVHAPALLLAEEIVERGPGAGWADKAFFSDDGSTAVEIAVKIGLRLFQRRQAENGRCNSGSGSSGDGGGDCGCGGTGLTVVAQRGCYHGDTLGAMDVGAPSVFNSGQHPWYRPRGLFLDTPTLAWVRGRFAVTLPAAIAAPTGGSGGAFGTSRRSGEAEGAPVLVDEFATRDAAFDLPRRLAEDPLKTTYLRYVRAAMDGYEGPAAGGSSDDGDDNGGGGGTLASLLLEPVVMGAGGMLLVDPLFQHVLADECRRRGLPVVLDEVFSGLHRLGPASGAELIGVRPDVACYAKLLTGGAVPLALTLASAEAFAAYDGASKAEALLHGHSYTGNPVGCAAALYSLRSLARVASQTGNSGTGDGDLWDDAGAVRRLSLRPDVVRCFSLGTVLALEVASAEGEAEAGYASAAAAGAIAALRRRGVMARPLGRVVYVMASPFTAAHECHRLLAALEAALDDCQRER